MRQNWDEHFIDLAYAIAQRSTCLTAQVGCLLVRDKRILSTGYNGAPSRSPHCTDQGYCYPDLLQCGKDIGLPSRAIHAEINAIAQAARYGVSIEGATAYITCHPCLNCAKALIASGISTVVYAEESVEDGDRGVLEMFSNERLISIQSV